MAASAVCICGHAKEFHEHYRAGSDCAECGSTTCSRYRRSRGFGKKPKAISPARESEAAASTDAPAASVRGPQPHRLAQ